jgi:hypothetical protein
MKEKIIAAIKALYPAVNLTKKRLEAIAAKIEAKCSADETQIDAQLTIYDDYNSIVDQAKTDDRIAAAELKAKKEPAKKEDTPITEPAKDPATDAMPEWAKTIMTELSGLKAEKQAVSIREKVSASLKEKNVDNEYWSEWALPGKEEDIPAFVEKVDTKYSAFTQGLADRGILSTTPPKIGAGGTPVKTTAPTKEELENVSKQIGI